MFDFEFESSDQLITFPLPMISISLLHPLLIVTCRLLVTASVDKWSRGLPSIQFFIPAKVNCCGRLGNFWTIRVRNRNPWSGWLVLLRQWQPLLWRRHNWNQFWSWRIWWPRPWPSSPYSWSRPRSPPPQALTLRGLQLGLSHGPWRSWRHLLSILPRSESQQGLETRVISRESSLLRSLF